MIVGDSQSDIRVVGALKHEERIDERASGAQAKLLPTAQVVGEPTRSFTKIAVAVSSKNDVEKRFSRGRERTIRLAQRNRHLVTRKVRRVDIKFSLGRKAIHRVPKMFLMVGDLSLRIPFPPRVVEYMGEVLGYHARCTLLRACSICKHQLIIPGKFSYTAVAIGSEYARRRKIVVPLR